MPRASVLLGLVPILGLAELLLHQYFAGRAPDADHYAALGKALLELKQPGVPVVVAPRWAEPLVRQAAPEAFPLAELARPDDAGFATFLEVSLLGQSAPELAPFSREQERELFGFRVSLRKNRQAAPTRFDFVTAVEEGRAEVLLDVADELAPCAWVERRAETGGLHGHVAYPRRRYECSRHVVGVSVVEDRDYRPRRCVLAQVPESGSVIVRFEGAPSSERLVGFVGASYFLERDVAEPELELELAEAGQPLARRDVSGAEGWTRFEARRPPGGGPVELRLRSLRRHAGDFCFALEAR